MAAQRNPIVIHQINAQQPDPIRMQNIMYIMQKLVIKFTKSQLSNKMNDPPVTRC